VGEIEFPRSGRKLQGIVVLLSMFTAQKLEIPASYELTRGSSII